MIKKNLLFKYIKSIGLWFFIIILTIVYVYKYNKIYNIGYEINYTFDGIKYQASNADSGIPIKISINGIYKKNLRTKGYMFEGDIIIDNEVCYSSYWKSKKYLFSKDNMSDIENNDFKGIFFIGDMMSEITIMISSIRNGGSIGFNFDDGWLISAPCETRSEAVTITNKLSYPLYKRYISFNPHLKSFISMR